MNLLSTNFWLAIRPPALTPLFSKIFIVTIGVFFVGAVVSWGLLKFKKGIYFKFFEEIYSFFIVNAFVGAIFYFLNYEAIPFLSSRFWFIVWFIEIAIWEFVLFKILKEISNKKREKIKKVEYEKYLP